MIPRPRVIRGPSGLIIFGFIMALGALSGPAALQAQEKQFALRFSSKSGDPSPRQLLPLRPNLTQDFFIYIENLAAQQATLKVEIQAEGLDGGSKTVTIQAGERFKQIDFRPDAKPGDKAAAPPPAPPAPPTPPVLAEIKGPVKVLLLDMTNKPIDQVILNLAQPKEYVDVKKITFNPKPSGDKKNQLRVELTANAFFSGPPCQVELVLDPRRIPGLVEGKDFGGTLRNFLYQTGAETTLTANNFEFKDNKEENGFVYLTIDGWTRALTFSTTFPREGTESSPQQVNTPVVRLLAPNVANPAKPLGVTIEADNLGEQVIELGFKRDGDGEFSKLNGDIIEFTGNRQLQLFFNPAFPGGALQLKPVLKDRTVEIDVAGVFGPRTLRARLLKDGVPDDRLNAAFGESVKQILHTVVFDGTGPEGVKFVNMPERLPRGAALPVSAVGSDPQSGIKEVFFFVGKLVDGKLPPNAITASGKLDNGVWSAKLDAPTDQKGKLDISVQFVNAANMATTDSIKIELVDPGPGGKDGGKASIAGKVTDLAGLGQREGVPVELREKGVVKDSTKTDKDSKYIFKDVAPGTYTISVVRTATSTKGSTTVQVKEGDKKTDVDVKLSR